MTTQTPRPATPAQLDYIRSLATQRAMFGTDYDRAATIARADTLLADELTAHDASTLIDAAIRAARHDDREMPPTSWEIKRIRDLATTNAIYGLSVDYDETVARVEAALANPDLVRHDVVVLIRTAIGAPKHPTAQTALRLSDIDGIDGLDISEGHYAVFDPTDTLRFYRIYTPTSGNNRDVPVIRRYAGSNLRGLYTGEAATVLHAINANPDEAAYRFSDTYASCWVCGRSLTDSISRLLSMGPTCRGFASHSGLAHVSQEVDHDPQRRQVYRAIRNWALTNGFTDPKTREDRAGKRISASCVASAWSAIPTIINRDPEDAVRVVDAAHRTTAHTDILDQLIEAPADTLLILIQSRVLCGDLLQQLATHPSQKVRDAAGEFFLELLQG